MSKNQECHAPLSGHCILSGSMESGRAGSGRCFVAGVAISVPQVVGAEICYSHRAFSCTTLGYSTSTDSKFATIQALP